jgi:tRNA A37 N6-isopentenylltransferase MiaA
VHPENIVIVGPTSSGKTNLATAISACLGIPIFNCDAIQVYTGLDTLSNKPSFDRQTLDNDEVVSTINSHGIINFPAYSNFTFRILRRKGGQFLVDKTLEPLEFFKWLIRVGFIPESPFVDPVPVTNYLFDIRKPGQSYSLAEYRSDIQRICTKNRIDAKLVVGGTIYYAHHFLMGTELESPMPDQDATIAVKQKFEKMSTEALVRFLENNDPSALTVLDAKNKVRLVKAAAFIEQTGNKFSEQYVKKTHMLDDFLLIMIQPKSREAYTKSLDTIVSTRITKESLEEIKVLEAHYGALILEWLENVSYEYRYAVKIYKLLRANPDVTLASIEVLQSIEELKAKERQYTKRQMTFMRKLEREVLK